MTSKSMDEREALKKKSDQQEIKDGLEETGPEDDQQDATESADVDLENELPDPSTKNKEEEDAQTKYLRLAADFQNYKRRSEKEKGDIYAFANEKIAIDLLLVLDNFERAFDHKEEVGDKSFLAGMEMIFKQLAGLLEKNGISEINAKGQEFDPNFHHAVMSEQTADAESGHVSAVLQKGYTLHGKVIRAAMVKVAE